MLLLAVVATLAPVSDSTPVALAQDGSDGPDLGLSVEPGFGNEAVAAAWTPVTVTIAPDVPVRGRLAVETDSDEGVVVQRREVEVAAGATERVILLVPPSSAGGQVTLGDGDRAATVAFGGGGSAALVGILDDSDFRDRVGAVTDPLTEQVWRTVDVAPTMLDLGPLVLESFGTLVADSGALARLGEAARQAIEVAVDQQGLHLVVRDVVADPEVGRAPAALDGGTLAPAMSAWPLAVTGDRVAAADPGAANGASISSGAGRVTWLAPSVGEDALRSPRMWGQVWTGTPLASVSPSQRRPQVDPWLLRQQGLRLPSSWGMTAFVAIYVAVAAAAVLLLVRRLRRPEFAWVLLPAAGLVLAAVAFAASSHNDTVGGRALATGTWVDGSGIEQLVVLGDFARTEPILPGPGWQVRGLSWPGAGAEATAAGTVLSRSGQDGFGEPAVVMATRASAVGPPVAVAAVRLPDRVQVEVVNVGDTRLDELRVSAGGLVAADAEGASLDPGETILVDVADAADGRWLPSGLVEDVPERAEPARASMAGMVNSRVDEAPALVWVRAVGEDVVTRPRGVGRVDLDVVAVGVTPMLGDPTAPAPTSRLVWSTPTDRGFMDDGPFVEDGFDGNGGSTWVRFSAAAPAAVPELAVDLPASDADCRTFTVWDDATGIEESGTLCGGREPDCPVGGTCSSDGGDAFEVCDADGSCQHWESRGTAASDFEVWDVEAGGYRPWTDLDAQVDGDPGRVVTPLGDVVVQVCCGTASFEQVDVHTGGMP